MPAACWTKRAMPAPVSDLQALIEPQERLDRLISVSFRRFGRSLVDLSYANPYDPPSERVLGALGAAVGESRERAFQYTRSEERRVGRECSSRWWRERCKITW